MNLLAHAVAAYAIGTQFTSDPKLLLAAVFFGILPDFDHITHIPRALKTGRFGPQSRSNIHELYGLTIIASITTILFYVNPSLAPLVFLPFLAHHLMDFLTRPTRPFKPVDETETHLKIYPKSIMGLTIADTIVTAGLIVWLVL